MDYYYLISSLPDVAPESDPPVRTEVFLSLCSDWLSAEKLKQLTELTLLPSDSADQQGGVIAEWSRQETDLRNRLALRRAGNKVEAASLRGEIPFNMTFDAAITDVWNQTDPRERERMVDRIRFRFLDELEYRHLFDFGRLCIYKLKLMLREKWLPRKREPGRAALELTLSSVEEHYRREHPARNEKQ